MHYISTRDATLSYTASQAILTGIAPDGGLFLPSVFPGVDLNEIRSMTHMDYPNVAANILVRYLDEYTPDEILAMVRDAYRSFAEPDVVAPLVQTGDGRFALELWHGPTLAFKDMALQVLPRLMSASRAKCGQTDCVLILVATSGDTGKAALEGFSDVDGTAISVFFPRDGVSAAQKLQMMTHAGRNVAVSGIVGNFDDAQTAVKAAFGDPDFSAKLKRQGVALSSANSINWGRLVPQIAYYFWAYAQLVRRGGVRLGDRIHFSVPTGNFGNILAGYYAKRMGLPVDKLICASNANNVLTDFFRNGCYDNRQRPFYRTMSPSMDILISSNLERLLFELCDREDATVREWMRQLGQTKRYDIPKPAQSALAQDFAAGYCDDARTAQTIRQRYRQDGYLMDPHTAVADCVLSDYRAATGDDTPCVVVSTASPFKFGKDVLRSLSGQPVSDEDPFALLRKLAEYTGQAAPENILRMETLPLLHEDVICADRLEEFLLGKIESICK